MSRSNPTQGQSRAALSEPIANDQHVIRFGRWKGRTVADVLELDPAWLIWAHNNVEHFELNHILLDRAEGDDYEYVPRKDTDGLFALHREDEEYDLEQAGIHESDFHGEQ